MQNPNSETPASGQNTNQTVDIGSLAQKQSENLSNEAKKQAENLANAAKDQVANVGNVMQDQMQNLGKAGVSSLGNMVGQFTQPLSGGGQTVQPRVTKDEKIYGALAYIPFVSMVCIILKPDSAFVRLHSKQGLLISVIFLFVGLLAAIVSIFGIIGQLLSILLGFIPLACLVIGVYSMYLAMTGYWWKIPVLGSVADLIPVEMMAKVSKENITGQVGIAKNDYDNRQETLQKESAEKKPEISPQMPNVGVTGAVSDNVNAQNSGQATVPPTSV